MEASHKKAPNAAVVRRRSKGGGKWVLVLILLAVGVGYFQRSRLLPWLEQNPRTAPIVHSVQQYFQPAEEKAGLPLTSMQQGATGGETTFSSGSGFGTVTPDDGSEAFRVVVPPNQTTN